MIDLLEMKLEALKKCKIVTKEELDIIQEMLDRVRNSILDYIEIMGARWCSERTGIDTNNFYYFSKKQTNWTIDRLIKVYKQLIK